MITAPDTFGAWIVRERRRHGWTQRALARRAGLGVRTLISWETGQRVPHPATRARLEAVLGVPALSASVPPPDPIPPLTLDDVLLRLQARAYSWDLALAAERAALRRILATLAAWPREAAA